MISRVRILLVLAVSVFLTAQIFAEESLEQTIDYLFHYVETSKAMFVRNGAEHTPAKAASHIKAKYEHFKNQVKTPEDFIRLSASKSLLTGKPYLCELQMAKKRS